MKRVGECRGRKRACRGRGRGVGPPLDLGREDLRMRARIGTKTIGYDKGEAKLKLIGGSGWRKNDRVN